MSRYNYDLDGFGTREGLRADVFLLALGRRARGLKEYPGRRMTAVAILCDANRCELALKVALRFRTAARKRIASARLNNCWLLNINPSFP